MKVFSAFVRLCSMRAQIWSLAFGFSVVSQVVILAMAGCDNSSSSTSFHPSITLPTTIPAEMQELTAKLHAEEPLTRASAARELGTVDANRDTAVRCLLAALKDENQIVRSAAAEALGQMGDQAAVEPLIALLANLQQDRDVRSRAAESLGNLGATAAVPALIKGLRDTVWFVRYQCCVALGKLKDASAKDALMEVSRYDANYSVREVAEQALENLSAGEET